MNSVNINWATSQVEIYLKAFSEIGKDAIPHILKFENVKDIQIPHKSPWGDSVQINRVTVEQGTYKIEMQSGDTIQVLASRFSFKQSAS